MPKALVGKKAEDIGGQARLAES